MTRIGSLFSGAGGLDMGVQAALGGHVVWHSEVDEAASKVLAYRYPGVPNLGDITRIDWAGVPAVDVLCGGFPCQDVSAAGKRAGIHHSTRSGLWAYFADAIDVLQPALVIIENVRGLLNATAHRNMESTDTTVGNGTGRPVLRAAGAVLGDLATLGYDAQWTTLAAADVDAPHRRERVFILAADAASAGARDNVGRLRGLPKQSPSAADAPRDGRDEGRPESARLVGGFDAAVSGDEPGVALLPTPQAFDQVDYVRTPEQLAEQAQRPNGGSARNLREVIVNELPEPTLLSTPQARDFKGVPADNFNNANLCRDVANAAQWGKYAPAIARWEQIVGPAPAPTEPNRNGKPRLNPEFSSWMMGWPAGWVTDPAIGISRNDQLRIIGNGVCPHQAHSAIRQLTAIVRLAIPTNRGAPNNPEITRL